MITLDLVLTAHVYNNDVLDSCACCIKLILLSVIFVLAEMDKMIELECFVMVKWISNVRLRPEVCKNTFVIIDLPLKMEVPVLAEHASFV